LGVLERTGVYPVNPFTDMHAAKATRKIEISLFIVIKTALERHQDGQLKRVVGC
jgi:hypothetical protein